MPGGYRHPPRSACEEVDFPADLGEALGFRHELHVNMWIYKGRTVRFSLEQRAIIGGRRARVARIDTCHGDFHRHVYDQDDNEILPTKLYAEIPEQGQDEVEQFYDEAFDVMARDWLELARRWQRGR